MNPLPLPYSATCPFNSFPSLKNAGILRLPSFPLIAKTSTLVGASLCRTTSSVFTSASLSSTSFLAIFLALTVPLTRHFFHFSAFSLEQICGGNF
ncbi:hypothetical protein AOQ84DRAFT_93197 [Glonium stellatum]|uniref:Uncharacterized protein n=1 Tax=Glonium stellatum TaxID=574774 RepID=A0A8E2EVL5_9PEZI|nr:hypothetical protein AOQ84DRAFT_93197 [Glonium stellatum]